MRTTTDARKTESDVGTELAKFYDFVDPEGNLRQS